MMEPVVLQTADGQQLVGALAAPQRVVASVVVLHPLPTHGGSMDLFLLAEAARRLPEQGIAVLRFNTRGTGGSTGTFDDGRSERFDVAVAVDRVRERGLPAPWLAGWSFGADLALRHGLLPGVRGAVLMAPPLRWAGDEHLAAWARSGRPVLALVPELDDHLPPDRARERFSVVPQAKVIPLAGARHLLAGYADRVVDELAAAVLADDGHAAQ